jgi:hypothetical protein
MLEDVVLDPTVHGCNWLETSNSSTSIVFLSRGGVGETTLSPVATMNYACNGCRKGATYTVRDTINHVDMADATSTVSAVVGEHDIAVLRLDPKH